MNRRYFGLRFSMRSLLLAVAIVAVAVWIFWERPRRALERQKSSGRLLIDARDKIYLESCFDSVVRQKLVTVLGDSRLTHWGRVHWLATPDKDTIISQAADRSLIVWNRKDGSIRHGFYDVSFAVYAPAAGLIFFGTEPHATAIWSVKEDKLLDETLNLPAAPRWVTPDGQRLIADDGRRRIKVMPREEPAQSVSFEISGEKTVGACDAAGTTLFLCDFRQLTKYDLATGTLQASTELPKQREGVFAAAFDLILTPDDSTLFLGDAAGRILEFDAQTCTLTKTREEPGGSINRLGYFARSGDEQLWVASSSLRALSLQGMPMRVLVPESTEGLAVGEYGAATSVMNGRIVVISGTRQERMIGGPRQDATCFAWSPKGDQIALGGRDGQIVIRNTADWSLARSWKAHEGWVRRLDWSPRGDVLLSLATDDILAFWNPATGVERHQRFALSAFHEWTGTFDAAGKRVAVHSGFNPLITILDCHTWQTIDSIPYGGLDLRGESQFSPDGQRLIVGGNKTIVSAWDFATQKVVTTLGKVTGDNVQLQLSADGQVAYVCDHRFLMAYNLASGALLWSTGVHPGKIFDVALHPSRPVIATAGSDGTVALVDTLSGLMLQRLRFGPTRGEVWQVGFSPGGQLLAIAMSNGAVVVIQTPENP